ncbi:MAG TPA: protein kinase [Gemmatimonadales bacterium]
MQDRLERLQACLGAGYRLERELGHGGMATVYVAHDLRHDRPVALKVLRPELSASLGPERFQREIRLAGRLQHPHILTVLDSGAGDGLFWYTMPLVEGESLRARLQRETQLPVDEAIRLTGEVADALDYAHGHGVLHRDIKPENILLSGNQPHDPGMVGDHALVTDFGVARTIEAAAGDKLTETGLILGTPAYMSPEQASGETALDARSDVYALGCVLYEMLAGEPPFQGRTAQVIAARRLTGPVPSVRQMRDAVSPGVEAAITRALAKVPADRFSSAGEFAAALRRGLAQAPQRQTGIGRRLWSAAAVLGIFLILAMAVRLLGRRSSAAANVHSGPIPLAVLPFRTLGSAADSGILAIGIPDAIITKLASVSQMRLRPTSAILSYQGRDADPREAGRALAVDYLLTGTVQSAADRLRVSVQLVRAEDGSPVWGQHYDLARQDLLTLQDSIAERVSGSLAVRMSAAERERIYRRYTDNAAAYEWYLRGRTELARITESGTKAAVGAFEHALALDSNYALARAGLAMASSDMHLRFATGDEVAAWGERAKREATRAIALDPALAEAHLARAAVARKSEFDWSGTLAESQRALELNPNLDLAHYFRAAAFYHIGLLRQAESEVEKALAVDPLNRVEQLRTRGVVAFLQADYPKAIDLLEQVRRTGSTAYADSYLSQAYFYNGDTAHAFQVLDSLTRSPSTPASSRARAFLATFFAAQGKRGWDKARALIGEVSRGSYMDHHVAYSLGTTYAQLRRPEEARRWLATAIGTGFPCYPWFARDTLLQPIRRDPGFRHLMSQLKQSWEGEAARYPPE